MYKPNGYLDDPIIFDLRQAISMATKEIQYHKNGGSPYITVSAVAQPKQQKKDVHFYHYYSTQNGTPHKGQNDSEQSGKQDQSYIVIANLEYGRLASIDSARSTPGVGGLPSQVINELQNVYNHIPKAMVIVMNNNGKFTIQAQIIADAGPQPPQLQQPPGYAQFPVPQNSMNPMIQHGPPIHPFQGQYQQVQFVPYGRPKVMYASPKSHRRRGYDEETELSFSDSDSDLDSRYDGRGRRSKNDDRSHLQKKYSELYRETKDEKRHRKEGRRMRHDDDDDRDRNRDRGRDDNRGPSAKSYVSKHGRASPKNLYRTRPDNEQRFGGTTGVRPKVLGGRY